METQYAGIAGDYARLKADDLADQYVLTPAFLETCGVLRGTHVLELACGDGRIGRAMIRAGAASVLGIDLEPEQIKLAHERRLSQTEYLVGDAASVVQYGEFDIVACPWTLHYAFPRKQLFDMFATVACNLKPGGIFVAFNEHPLHPVGGRPEVGVVVKWIDAPLQEGSRMSVTLYNRDYRRMAAFTIHHWSIGTYIDAAHAAGLDFDLIEFVPSAEARSALGASWAELFMRTGTSCIFRGRHTELRIVDDMPDDEALEQAAKGPRARFVPRG